MNYLESSINRKMKLIVLGSGHSPSFMKWADQSFFNIPDQWFYRVFEVLQFRLHICNKKVEWDFAYIGFHCDAHLSEIRTLK